jgi:hypothetical protein
MANTAEVLSPGQVLVTEVTAQAIEITASASPAVVEVTTAGPQGIQGLPGNASPLSALPDVNTEAAVHNSVLFYDADSQLWVGNDVNTTVTLTDGGAF